MREKRKMCIRNVDSENLFSLFEKYVKESVARDISQLYKEEPAIIEHDGQWVFRIKKSIGTL